MNYFNSEPKGEFSGTNYSEDIEINGIRVKISFSTENMDSKTHSSCEFKTMAIKANLESYYDVFKNFPSTGEVIGQKKGGVVFIKNRYFLVPEYDGEFVEPAKNEQEFLKRKEEYNKKIEIGLIVETGSSPI